MTETIMRRPTALDSYRLLGRSGLRVSPLALGTMTFGTEWNWGSDEAEASRIFDHYVGEGGNFIDTANRYTEGSAERMVGQFSKGRRHGLVIATKYTLPMTESDPNSGGNHRKSLVRSVEDSLRRLATDYVDILYLHAWDFTTPVEEILRAMDDVVRSGKVLYLGISDTPAWQVSRMQAIADLRGWSPLVAYQAEYSLIERTTERDVLPMACEMGLGLVPWSPLASGVLTGKYSSADVNVAPSGSAAEGTRRDVAVGNGSLTERGLGIAEVVRETAERLGRTPSQVSLAWVLANPAVTAPIIGARTLAQLVDNLGALDIGLDDRALSDLKNASAIDLGFPHTFLQRPMTRAIMFGSDGVPPRRTSA